MNRDRFKFRVWHKLEQKYISENVSVTTRLNRNGLLFIDGSTKAHVDKFVIVEFCTGLKDKNGTLIYEGDVIFDGFCKRTVEWQGWFWSASSKTATCPLDKYALRLSEIVGNIHEQKDDK